MPPNQKRYCRAMMVSPKTKANNSNKQILDDLDHWDQWPLYFSSGIPRQSNVMSMPNSIGIMGKLLSRNIVCIITVF
ncbi:MAG: hypothetical protein RTV31_10390 [Candidatus Thorarchaeota archaeon]